MSNILNKTGIYIIENIKNGKSYIGSTRASFSKRFKEHLKLLRKEKHHSIKLQNAWNKHGKDAFKFRVLEVVNKDFCREVEQKWIDNFMPEYNMTMTVGTPIETYSRELRAKISKAHGGRPFEVYKDNILIGVYENQSFCAEKLGILQSKIYKCLKGEVKHTKGYMFKYVGEDFKYVNRKKGNNYRKGKKHSEKTKIKMSKSNSNNKYDHYEVHCPNLDVLRFNTVKEIASYLNCTVSGVSNVIAGRRNTIKKHKIKIITGEINEYYT